MLTVAWRVGRLIEARLGGNPTEADVARFQVESAACVMACVAQSRRPAIVCTDTRETELWRPEAAEHMIQLMRGANSNVERNACLGNGRALFTLQVGRLLREAGGNGRRRLFTESTPLFSWLDQFLGVEERKRLRVFVAEGDPPRVPDPDATLVTRVRRPTRT